MIPHAPIPVDQVRPLDLWLLLVVGACYEAVVRGSVTLSKSKSKSERKTEVELRTAKYEAAKKRRLGPSAFVETSKLERVVLNKEKELAKFQVARDEKIAALEKLSRTAGYVLYGTVFLTYYGISLLTIDGMRVETSPDVVSSAQDGAAGFLNAMLFPISYVGVGMKISRFGIPNPASSIGALVVLWSAQVTVGKVIDCLELMLP